MIRASKTGRSSKAARPTQIGKRGAVEINPLAAHDLRLPKEGKMIGVFGDQYMRDRGFRRQPPLDQPCRYRSVDDAVGARPTHIWGDG